MGTMGTLLSGAAAHSGNRKNVRELRTFGGILGMLGILACGGAVCDLVNKTSMPATHDGRHARF